MYMRTANDFENKDRTLNFSEHPVYQDATLKDFLIG